ncbi:MAG: SDR family NAD(P)-dependent oxidoreductase [Vulcanimicrobiaceae bacterium]
MPLTTDLTGRVALVTGGSKGIGAATVRHLHQAGASVFFTYRSDELGARALCTELGPRLDAAFCDLADHDALPGLLDTCIARFGRIDVLVNNAATFDENPFFGNDYAAWRRGWTSTFAVNVFGAAHLTYLALQRMREQGAGKIINVASRAAHRGELTFADYGASKAALVNPTKSVARSCAKDGIVSIAIAPGFIETEMAAQELQRRRDEIAAEIPAGYIGTPEDVAGIIAFFAGDAGNYANGATVDVNGGSYVR